MLIVTSSAMDADARRIAAGNWPEPHVVVGVPDAPLDADQVAAARHDGWVVVEALTPPSRRADLFCEVMYRLRRVAANRPGPLLFSADPTDPNLLATLRAELDAAPATVRHEAPAGSDADTGLLLMGTDVAGHPLAADFFDHLRGRAPDGPRLADLARRMLVPEAT